MIEDSYARVFSTLRRRHLSLIDLAIIEMTQHVNRTPGDIALELGCSDAHVSTRINQLHKLGLVTKRRGELNARKIWVLATCDPRKILTQQPTKTHQK